MSNLDIIEDAIRNCRKSTMGMPVRCLIMHPDMHRDLVEEVLRNDLTSIVMISVKLGYYKGISIYRSTDLSSAEVKAY